MVWLAHVESEDGSEDDVRVTQPGIAQGVGADRGHVSRTVAPLITEGWLDQRRVRLPGFSRTLVGYRLTEDGRRQASRIQAVIQHLQAPTRRHGTPSGTMSIKQFLARPGTRVSAWEAFRELERTGGLEVEATSAGEAPVRFVKRLADAPTTSNFVGREGERKSFRVWLSSASSFYFLEAGGGVGKSSLVAHAVRGDDVRSHVLWVRLADWFDGENLLRMMDRLLADLGRPNRLEALEKVDLDSWQSRLKGLPVIVVVDDVQKAAPSAKVTLQLLERLAGRVSTLKTVFIGRSLENVAGLVPRGTNADIGPLPERDARQLLASLGVAPDMQGEMLSKAHGNPLFLRLLARGPGAEAADLPRYITQDVVAALPPASAKALGWTSCLRRPFSAELLQRLDVGDAAIIEHLRRQGLVVAAGEGLFELHDVVRAAVHDGLDFDARKRIHDRLAECFRPRAEEWSGMTEFLHHLVLAGRREEAMTWVLRHRTHIMERARELFEPRG